MLIYSMTASADGYVTDRDGGIGWTVPTDELFAVHLERVRGLGAHLCGRRLYETMLPWETDPALRATELGAEFADVWSALPKVVFSRTLDSVGGNARLASASLADEIAALDPSAQDVEIGGAELAAQALRLGLIDDFRLFRAPVVLGGGTPYWPALPTAFPLELVECRTVGAQITYERYGRG